MTQTVRPRHGMIGRGGVALALGLGVLLVPGHRPLAAHTAIGDQAHRPLLSRTTARATEQVRVIVQAQGPERAIHPAIARLGGRVSRDLPLIHAVAATLPAAAVPALAATSGVRYVSPDAPTIRTGTTYACCAAATLQQVYPQAIGAAGLWTAATPLQGQGVGVAVVDSGISSNNDLGAKRVVAMVKLNSADTEILREK